jgi:hypothetical protein
LTHKTNLKNVTRGKNDDLYTLMEATIDTWIFPFHFLLLSPFENLTTNIKIIMKMQQ